MDKEIAIETIVDLLEKGNSVELPATGYSMFPSIKPGANVLVRPLQMNETPQPGYVIVFRNSKGLVMHRLIRIDLSDSGNPLFITRGDSMTENDEPWQAHQLIGVAVSFNSRKKARQLKSFVPSPLRYIYNRKLFWIYNMLKRLSNFMNSQN
ncbi:MAG: hypothetical protein C0408_07680 [Odoribacter sp.]|nr:hypothetical protein [Odoribacter sp.]